MLKADVPLQAHRQRRTLQVQRHLQVAQVSLGTNIAEFCIQQIIEFACDYFLMVNEKKGKLTREDYDQLFQRRFTSTIGFIVSKVFQANPTDKVWAARQGHCRSDDQHAVAGLPRV